MRQRALIVETPEGVTFSYELATPAVRAFAWALDAFVAMAATSAVSQALSGFQIVSPDWAAAVGALCYFAISIGYGILCEWRWRGQTIGKRLFRLRVVDSGGLRLRVTQVVLRNLMRAFDMLPVAYLAGGLAAVLSAKSQRLGDLVANTVVVRERPWKDPDIERIAPAKYNSLLLYPSQAARLRSLADPEAVAMAVRAVTRRDEYDPLARVELFRQLAAHFRAAVTFPPAALEGISDEEYVRSVLRVIYRG